MVDVKPKEDPKVENPTTHFDNPNDIVRDVTLSLDQKKKALNTWEQDARQLLTASNEGMTKPKRHSPISLSAAAQAPHRPVDSLPHTTLFKGFAFQVECRRPLYFNKRSGAVARPLGRAFTR